LKAALKRQKLEEELRAQEEVSAKSQSFVKDLFERAEKEKRETQKQMEVARRETTRDNIITMFNLATSSLASMVSNPKFLFRTAYFFLLVFGAF